ncbi:MAG: hypothetical protein WDO18_01205 [Acidobacteriota bacterium]
MFSRRVATFSLGLWIGCCLLVDTFALQGYRIAERVVNNPLPEARELVAKSGASPTLLRHLAGEQTRSLIDNWEPAQLVIAGVMLILLVFTDQRKIAAIAVSSAMGAAVILQHYFLTPDWILLGRQADFLPEAASFSLRARIWTITQTYGAVEILKLLAGGALASYFFVMETSMKRGRRQSSSRSRSETADVPAN